MNEGKREFHLEYGGKKLTIETGRLAKQADGSVLVTCEGTQVLVTVCSAKEVADGQDFFPLMVDYREKYYSAGKFLGGFMKREARPGTHETLNSRLIDRPLRPLFPSGYMAETIIMPTVMSFDENADPEVLGALGAAAALAVSDIPFNGPLGTLKIGRIDGQWVINPAQSLWKESDLEMVVAASKDAIMMVEGEANELTEAEMIEALQVSHAEIKKFCELVETMKAEVGKPKREFISAKPNEKMMDSVKSQFTDDARSCLNIDDKLLRQNAVKALESKVTEAIAENPENFGLTADDSGVFGKESYKAVDHLMYEMMRNDILKEGKRIAGRGMTEVRQIETEVNVLRKTHGSSLFTRGETQVLAAVTMGGEEGEQSADRLHGMEKQKFYLHYQFPPYSVGEARGYRGVGRRELGHGNLAERAIKKVIPASNQYTLRVNCEVLESNGSSSMGSVCSASMALMDAGIPLNGPVAGVAMGLVKEGDEFAILTDILGDEDHLGDMDFKVAGTDKGITAIQMDIKIAGITEEIFTKAMSQAKEGRIHILNEMAKTITEARKELKDGVPKMETLKIDTDKIGALIGPGGKNIKGLQEQFGVNISIEEDGTVQIVGSVNEQLNLCKRTIDLQINGPKVGDEYDSVVSAIKEYGAFVDLAPGTSGLVHVSEIAEERVNDVNEYLAEGDEIRVKVIELDRFGRFKLSAKAVKPLSKKS